MSVRGGEQRRLFGLPERRRDVSFVVDSTILTISLGFDFSPDAPDLLKSSQM